MVMHGRMMTNPNQCKQTNTKEADTQQTKHCNQGTERENGSQHQMITPPYRRQQYNEIVRSSLVPRCINNINYERNLIVCNSSDNQNINNLAGEGSHYFSDAKTVKCNNDSFEKCLNLFKTNVKFIKIVNFNAQGLLEGSHLEHIHLINGKLGADIVAVSESWLNKSICNKLINMNGYKLIRSDRNFKSKNVRKGGGGVCVFLNDSLRVKCIEKSNGANFSLIDFLILEIQSPKIKFLFCNLYRHGDCSDSETNILFHRIIELSIDYQHVVVCGDFNANAFDGGKFCKLHVLNDYMTLMNDQCPTYIAGHFNPSQLDLMYTKNPNDVKHFGHFPAIGISNHQATYGIMNFYTTKREVKTYEIRNFKDIDDEKIENFTSKIDWTFFSCTNNIDGMIDKLYQILNQFLNEICPLQVVKSRYKPVPWMTDEIKDLMKQRKTFYELWKINRNHQAGDVTYKSYNELNGKIKNLIRNSKRQCFIDDYGQTDGLREKWNLIHKFGITSKSRKNEAHNAKFGDEFTTNKLNEHFVKLKPLPKHDLALDRITSQFDFEIISGGDIQLAIAKISSNATGPDKIPPMCFKLLANYLYEPISNIINASFLSGYFPNRLKNVSVNPIPKIENPKLLSQFRPISNANYLLKIISTITCEQLTNYLEENNILNENQSGFRKSHSCTTAILKLTEDLHGSISNGKCVVLVLLDFSNAFGSVDHDRLLQCLKAVGISNHAMKWYKSFINGWQQTVKHGEETSISMPITRGIIQGENNSQLFFSIFINNIVKYIEQCRVILFADDVQLYIECDVGNIHDGIGIINGEMKNIEQFCNDYGIEINPDKTKAIIISSKNNVHKLNYNILPKICINGECVEYVDGVRNLGYRLNRTATGESHVKLIQQKVYGALQTLNPLRALLPSGIKLQLYKTLILPIFDYMDIVYHGYGVHGSGGDSDKLERLQNMCIRFILNVNKRDHITPHRDSLKLIKLHDRRTMHVASTINKILNGDAPPYLNSLIRKNENNTRSQNKLIIRKPCSNFHKQSFFVSGPTLWNTIPNEIREISNNGEFREQFYKHLLDKNRE